MWTYQEANPWQTTADQGRILPDGETLELSKNVVIIQVDDVGKPANGSTPSFLLSTLPKTMQTRTSQFALQSWPT